MKSTKDGVYGAILGHCIGDSLGAPTEFNKSRKVRELQPAFGYPYPVFTDDSQCMLAIAETILANEPYVETEVFMKSLGKHFFAYVDGRWGTNDRSPGPAVLGGISALRRGEYWKKSGGLQAKGDGSVMRVSCIGAAYFADPEYAFKVGCLTSIPTHNNIEAILASGVAAYLVARCINNVPLDIALGEALRLMSEYEPETSNDKGRLFAITHLASAYAFGKGKMSPTEFNRFNGNDFKGLECLSAALFHNVRNCRFTDIARDCANLTGDSDSVAAVASGIAGARFGYGWIPRRWRNKVEKSEYLHDVAKRIYGFSQQVKEVLVEKYTPALTAF